MWACQGQLAHHDLLLLFYEVDDMPSIIIIFFEKIIVDDALSTCPDFNHQRSR
jgi:hypothetical protein